MEISFVVLERPLSLGDRCRLIRVSRNARQHQVAIAARVSPSDVSMLERDLPVSSAAKHRILTFLNLDEERLSRVFALIEPGTWLGREGHHGD